MAAPTAKSNGATHAKVRRHKRGQRLAAVVRRSADELTPLFVELLVSAIREIAAPDTDDKGVR
jgi:hypothetical protein